jgi:hypothetical protein
MVEAKNHPIVKFLRDIGFELRFDLNANKSLKSLSVNVGGKRRQLNESQPSEDNDGNEETNS